MRKNGKNKKLALLVGMAMAFSAAYSVAPSDAFAATYTIGTTTSDTGTSWEVKDEKGDTVTDASTADKVKELLKTSSNDFTLNNATLTALKGSSGNETEIGKGNSLTVTEGGESATKITYTAGEGAKIGESNSKAQLSGNYSSISVEGGSSTATEVSLATGSKVDSFNVVSGKAELSGGTATTINVADNAELSVSSSGLKVDTLNVTGNGKLSGSSATITAKNITATGDSVDLSGVTLANGSEDGDTLTITNTSGSVKLGDVAAGVTVNANGVEAGAVADGAVINGGTGDVKVDSITLGKTGEGSATAGPTITGNNIEITSDLSTDGSGTITATGNVKFDKGENVKNLKITAGGTVDVSSTAMTNDNMANIKANKLVTTGTVTVSDALSGISNIETTGAFTASGSNALNLDSVTAGNFTNSVAGSDGGAAEVNIKSLTVNGAYSNSGTVNVDSLKLGEKATISTTSSSSDTVKAKINAKTIILDTSNSDLAKQLGNLDINGANGSSDVKIVLASKDGNFDLSSSDNEDLAKAIAKAVYGSEEADAVSKVLANSSSVKNISVSDAEDALSKAQGNMKSEYNMYTAADIQTKIANADPFTTKLPSLADLQAMNSSDDQKNFAALTSAQKDYYDALVNDGKLSSEQRDQLVAAMPKTVAEQAEKIRAAVQNAGKTAAAPAITSARTAAVVADVVTTNVVNRTAELRSFVPSAESEEKPDNLWFQYKHSKTDVDSGDVYSKSTVKTNSYQLGYDAKVSDTDIVGGYVGTTTGSAEFNGPARSGSVDIKNALDLGLYGTHMMSKGQYLDYMLHRNKFDNRTMGQTYGTTDLGAMLRYGVKIAQPNGLTLDPYIQLAYDKISVDSYQAGENTISSDDSNNFSTKIGLNLITTGGLYGGVAYSRGLSGSYSAYVNGIAMPTQDNDTNVIYLNLGYRAGIARDIFLDLSLEKTFCDYDGWNAAGKVNFYF